MLEHLANDLDQFRRSLLQIGVVALLLPALAVVFVLLSSLSYWTRQSVVVLFGTLILGTAEILSRKIQRQHKQGVSPTTGLGRQTATDLAAPGPGAPERLDEVEATSPEAIDNWAVAAFREVLKERTREKVPRGWAATQYNLGNALLRIGKRELDLARLTEAVTAYGEALKEYTREKVPLWWAETQSNLGHALKILGDCESDRARLEEAVAAYREALKEYTRERVPLQWAETQHNLGSALWTLWLLFQDPAWLNEAVAAYREALKERTREKVPLDWAATQDSLGSALLYLGRREWDPARLNEAVAAYHEALKERTREKVPLQWAETQHNLASALEVLGERESNPARLEASADAYEAALLVFRPARANDYLIQLTEKNLQRVQKEIAKRKNAKSESGEKAQ
jgi:hypothetical protein